jgi:hypothetical protein
MSVFMRRCADNAFAELKDVEAEREAMVIPDEELVAEYHTLRAQLDTLRGDFREIITHPAYALPFLQPGRLITVKFKEHDFGWGVLVNYSKRPPLKESGLDRQYDCIADCSFQFRTLTSSHQNLQHPTRNTSSTSFFFALPTPNCRATARYSMLCRQACTPSLLGRTT